MTDHKTQRRDSILATGPVMTVVAGERKPDRYVSALIRRAYRCGLGLVALNIVGPTTEPVQAYQLTFTPRDAPYIWNHGKRRIAAFLKEHPEAREVTW